MALPDDLIASLGETSAVAAAGTVALTAAMQVLNTSIQIASLHLTQTFSQAIQGVAASAASAATAISAATQGLGAGQAQAAAQANLALTGLGQAAAITAGAATVLSHAMQVLATGVQIAVAHLRSLPTAGAAGGPPIAGAPGSTGDPVVAALVPIARDIRLSMLTLVGVRDLLVSLRNAVVQSLSLPVPPAAIPPAPAPAPAPTPAPAPPGRPRLEDSSRPDADTAPAFFSFTGGLQQAVAGLAQMGVGLAMVVDALTPIRALGSLAARGLQSAVDAVSPLLRRLGEDLSRAGQSVLQALAPLGQRIASMFAPLAPAVSFLADRISRVAAGLGLAGTGAATAALGVGRAVGGAALAGAGAVGAGVGAATSLVGGTVGVFNQVTSQAARFVESLNPASMLVFQQALRDLSATIGVALQPVIGVATAVLRDFAATLRPVMERLRPVIQQVAEAFGKVLGTAINAFGSIMQALSPVIKFVADAIASMAPVIQAQAAIFSGLVEVVGLAVRSLLEMLGIDVGDITSGLRSAFESLARGALLAAGFLVKMFGGGAFEAYLSGVRAALLGDGVEKKDATGLAAPTSASVSDLTSFGRTVTQAALLAGPDSSQPAKTTEQWLEEAVRKLEEMKDMNPWEEIKKTIKDGLEAIANAASGAVWKPVGQAAEGFGSGVGKSLGLGESSSEFGRGFARGLLGR